jgi:hypothetical protein
MNDMPQQNLLDQESGVAAAPHMVARVSSIAIKAAFPFLASDDVRYYLMGVNIRPLEDGSVMIAATDGHRFIVIRDQEGYVEKEVVVHVVKDAIKHAASTVTFDVMSNGQVLWNDAVTNPLFIQPGNSIIDGNFPRIETVVDTLGYHEGITGAVNTNFLADALKIKVGSKAPSIRFFTRDSDSPLLFLLGGIGEIEILGGIMKTRGDAEWLPNWLPAPGAFELDEA